MIFDRHAVLFREDSVHVIHGWGGIEGPTNRSDRMTQRLIVHRPIDRAIGGPTHRVTERPTDLPTWSLRCSLTVVLDALLFRDLVQGFVSITLCPPTSCSLTLVDVIR